MSQGPTDDRHPDHGDPDLRDPDQGPDESQWDEAELDRALEEDDRLLVEHLRTLLDPDADLGTRTVKDVDRALRGRNTLGSTLDLLGIGWWTARALLTDDHAPADRDDEGR